MADDPIDFKAKRELLRPDVDKPEPSCIRHDEYGRPVYRYQVDFVFNGSGFAFELWAYNQDEAEGMVAAINANGVKFAGQVIAEMPA